jgi:ArsR family transcriptional regulator, arsenate/arsenite/antimonite-responsive transcriptional repressor / arsenate reductase (thioredoxin)
MTFAGSLECSAEPALASLGCCAVLGHGAGRPLTEPRHYQTNLIYLRCLRILGVVTRVSGDEGTGGTPLFLRLAGHPIRWRLLGELARSDRAVRELTWLLGEPQSLVSYHLGQLRNGKLVTVRRSSADRRDSYYAVDLARCSELLRGSGAALHPGLELAPLPPPDRAIARGSTRRCRVLFLCTGNGARSQIAEALLHSLSNGTVEVMSAGSHPKPVHPNAVRVMRQRGIDISAKRSKHLSEFTRRRFDFVITLCDRVREVCPEFPGLPEAIHWSIPDPALEGETDRASYPAFDRTAREIEPRIRFLLSMIDHTPRRRSQSHGQRRHGQRPLHGRRRR